MWLIDFNQCKVFNPERKDVTLLVKAFKFNDPYYPDPSSKNENDMALWKFFRDRYLDTSKALIPAGATYRNMPAEFIRELERQPKSARGLF